MPLDRTLRHFGWMVAFLAVAYAIGLLPGLFLLILLHSRFEFGERWRTALISAAAVIGLSWLMFDRIFALVWPQSILSDMVSNLPAGLHIL
jgi:ABC-type sugar transport system permease subunit